MHQLRYYLAFGDQTGERLARDGHAYLVSIEPLVFVAAVLAVGGFVGRLAGAWEHPEPDREHATDSPDREPVPAGPGRRRALGLWLLCAGVLFAVYCGQELLEGLFATGHPGGLAGVLGHGGWLAAPVAVVVGATLAAALRIAEALVSLAGRGGARRRPNPRPGPGPALRRGIDASDWRIKPSSGVGAGRAPPLPA